MLLVAAAPKGADRKEKKSKISTEGLRCIYGACYCLDVSLYFIISLLICRLSTGAHDVENPPEAHANDAQIISKLASENEELRQRLDRLEKLMQRSLGIQSKAKDAGSSKTSGGEYERGHGVVMNRSGVNFIS